MLSDFDTAMMVAILVAAILRSSAYTALCAIAYLIQLFTSDFLSDELYYMSAIIIDSAHLQFLSVFSYLPPIMVFKVGLPTSDSSSEMKSE